jgi:prenyltransferase beta subunit
MKRVKFVAIALAFTIVLVASATQPVAAASRYDILNTYMTDHYDAVRGGYFLPFDGVTRINPTFGALSVMNEIGVLAQRPPPIVITDVLDFIEGHQSLSNDEEASYGGFSNYLLAEVTGDVNYNGLLLWNMLKDPRFSDIPGVNDYDINATANAIWVNSTVSEDGGYSLNQAGEPDIISTFRALASFRILEDMYPLENVWDTYVNETAVLAWIESCRDGDYYKLSPDSVRTSVSATASAVLAYEAVDEVSLVPGASAIQNWLRDRQVLEYQEPEYIGGFEEGNATGAPNLVSTYYAMKALESMNALSGVNVSALESFVINCQAVDGSWANSPGFSEGSLLYAGYACEILNMDSEGRALSLLSSLPNPNEGGPSTFDWRIIVVIGIIVVAAVIALYALRMD